MDKNAVKKYIIAGAVWASTEKAVVALMAFLLSIFLARTLPLDQMGGYFLALNLATFFSIIARMGLDNTMVRFISSAAGRNDLGYAKKVVIKGLVIAASGSMFVGIFFYLFLGPWITINLFQSDVVGSVTGLIAVWLVLLALQFLISEIFRGYQDIFLASLFGGALTVTLAVLLLVLYSQTKHVLFLGDVLSCIVIACTINVLIAAWMINRRLQTIKQS
jgi:O-antigen/teichoic acid export membrane protein